MTNTATALTWTREFGAYHAEDDDRTYLIERAGRIWTLTIYLKTPVGTKTEVGLSGGTLRAAKRHAADYRRLYPL